MFRFNKRFNKRSKKNIRNYNHRCGSLSDNNGLKEGKENLDKILYTTCIIGDKHIKLNKCESIGQQDFLPENNLHNKKEINIVKLEFNVNSNISLILSLLNSNTFSDINTIKPTNNKNNFGFTIDNNLNIYECNILDFKKAEYDFLRMLKEYYLDTKYLYLIDNIAKNNDLKQFESIRNEIMMGIDMQGFFDVNFQHVTDVIDSYINFSLQKHTLYYADLTVIKQLSLYDNLIKFGIHPKICLNYLPTDTQVNFNINTTSNELMKNYYFNKNTDLLIEGMKWIVSPLIPKTDEFYKNSSKY